MHSKFPSFFSLLNAAPYCLRNLSLGIDVDYNSETSARSTIHWTLQYTDVMGEGALDLHFSLCRYPSNDDWRACLRVFLVTRNRNSIQSNKKRNFLKVFCKDFIYLFLERREGKEKEKERNINVWLPLTWPPPRNLFYLGPQPRPVPCAGNRTGDSLGHRTVFNPLSHTRQGQKEKFLTLIIQKSCSLLQVQADPGAQIPGIHTFSSLRSVSSYRINSNNDTEGQQDLSSHTLLV